MRGLLTRMFSFLGVSSGCLLFVSSVFTFVCVFFVSCLSLFFILCLSSIPYLYSGDDVVCWLSSCCAFPSVWFPCFFSPNMFPV